MVQWSKGPKVQKMRERVHCEELLDAGSGSDQDVAASLADLRRINRWLGGARVLRTLLAAQVRRLGLTRFSLLDAGAGSADLAAAVRRWYPAASVTACDLHWRHLRMSLEPDRASVGLVCADFFRQPFQPRSFDFVAASLFVHHFTDAELPVVLQKLARLARQALLINDLDRHWIPLAFLRLAAPVFARSPITRFDAPASIHRGFRSGELERAARAAGFDHFRSAWHFPFRRSLVIEL